MSEAVAVMRARGVAMVAALAVLAPAVPSPAWAEAPPHELADTVSPDLLRLKERQRRVEALSELFARQTRVYRLGYPLLYAALDMCPEQVRAAAGFTYANAYMFRGPVRGAASAIGYGHRVTVVDVVADSAAAAAGIHPRDVLLEIDDWPAPYGEGAVSLTAAKLRDTLERAGRATLTLRRGSGEFRATVQPDYICDLRVLAAPGEAITAYGDSERVVVFHALMDFADDDELAAVIAREIANSLIPGLDIEGVEDDSFALSNFFNWGMEPAQPTGDLVVDQALARDWGIVADYVGAYLLARAGFDHRKGLAFWHRLAASGAAGAGGSYPPREAADLLRLEAAAHEIDAKLAARQPLVPAQSGVPEAVAVAPVADGVGLAVTEAPRAVEGGARARAPALEIEGLPWRTAAAEAEAARPPAPAFTAGEPADYRMEVAPLPEPGAAPPPDPAAEEARAPAHAGTAALPPAPAVVSSGFSFSAWFGGE
jgi:hypothetical protein